MLYCYLCCSVIICVALCIDLCTVPLSPGVNPIAVDKYMNINTLEMWHPTSGLPENFNKNNYLIFFDTGRDSSVVIATPYGPDGPGIESRWGAKFSAPVQTNLRTTQPPIQWVLGLSQGLDSLCLLGFPVSTSEC